MSKPVFQVGRNLSEHRIAAYSCLTESSGVVKGKRVSSGWYGLFDEARLEQELLPKLAQFVGVLGVQYPFLITSYTLERKTDVSIERNHQRVQSKDVKFRPRRRNVPEQYEAIVHSRSSYQLLR